MPSKRSNSQTVQGIITAKEDSYSSGGSLSDLWWKITIWFSYPVADNTYYGRVKLDLDLEDIINIGHKLSRGNPVTIYYSPLKPWEGEVEIDAQSSKFNCLKGRPSNPL